MTECATDSPEVLLRAAMATGSAADLDAFASSGHSGLERLRQELLNERHIEVPDTHERDVLDNLGAAVSAIAVRNPADFLEVFADPAFDTNTFVLDGLGHIADDEATKRLVAATTSSDWQVRMSAAIGLGGHSAPDARTTLAELRRDPDSLVRHHAAAGLVDDHTAGGGRRQ